MHIYIAISILSKGGMRGLENILIRLRQNALSVLLENSNEEVKKELNTQVVDLQSSKPHFRALLPVVVEYLNDGVACQLDDQIKDWRPVVKRHIENLEHYFYNNSKIFYFQASVRSLTPLFRTCKTLYNLIKFPATPQENLPQVRLPNEIWEHIKIANFLNLQENLFYAYKEKLLNKYKNMKQETDLSNKIKNLYLAEIEAMEYKEKCVVIPNLASIESPEERKYLVKTSPNWEFYR